MFCIGTAPYADQALGTRYLAVGIGREFQITASRIVDAGFLDVHQIPVRAAQLITLKLQGTLSEHYANGMLTEDLVVGQRILHLPSSIITLVGRGRGVVGIVVTREIVFLQSGTIVAPE